MKKITKKYGKFKKNKLFCAECGTKNNLTIHHIKKKSNGGSNKRENMMVLCRTCHNKEHN